MSEQVEEFIKKWCKENNTEEAVYSSYHLDAMLEFAKGCKQQGQWESVEGSAMDVGVSVYLHRFDYGVYDGRWFLDDDGEFHHEESGTVWDYDEQPEHYYIIPEIPQPPTK